MISFITHAILIGVGATAILDLWVYGLHRMAGMPRPNWAPVGRWFCYLAQGRMFHEDIARSPPFRSELVVGWIGHYVVGILFAVILLIVAPAGWVSQPTVAPALAVGIVTVGAGWFILQPGMGAGIASSKRPNPNRSRILSLVAHVVFGLGMYAIARLIA
ncbi:DUF2938 domain-containing protein [Microvirga antarctica]|uniref:DUF2938 domain-containing protein n=1 Tax=Microvirga antarctica TaxID=2819233 RepID=UPI001B316D24